MSNESLKILIPMIRRVLPAIMADDLVGVQPMQESEWRTGEGKGQMRELEYWVQPPVGMGQVFAIRSQNFQKRSNIAAMQIWCEETFGMEYATDWYKQGSAFYFLNETDRTAFMLRWVQ